MPENTTLNSAAGSVRAFFGTSKARGLGLVISSHNHQHSGEEAVLKDEEGNNILKEKHNIVTKGTLTGTMLMDASGSTTYADARAALAVGATFVIPSNKALRSTTGLPIIDDVDEQTGNEDFATISISYTIDPGITAAISGSLSPAED